MKDCVTIMFSEQKQNNLKFLEICRGLSLHLKHKYQHLKQASLDSSFKETVFCCLECRPGWGLEGQSCPPCRHHASRRRLSCCGSSCSRWKSRSFWTEQMIAYFFSPGSQTFISRDIGKRFFTSVFSWIIFQGTQIITISPFRSFWQIR